ncbi:MAG: hypothetical protein H0T85_02425 [Geodermatophilaceae bacterium]|nr:hypothetical protein [Geodermatophilaceae bacterium]
MLAVRRPAVMLMGVSVVLAGVVACASSVEGEASYAGAGPTTETTQTTTETTTETTETTTVTEPAPTPDEFAACLAIPVSDIDAFGAFNDLADMPEDAQTPEARMAVAAQFDTAQQEVQTYIDPLPAGPIKDAAIGYQAKQIEVRDALTAGDDVSTQIILDAQDVLEAACGTD